MHKNKRVIKGEKRTLEIVSPTDGAILEVSPDLTVRSTGFDSEKEAEDASGENGATAENGAGGIVDDEGENESQQLDLFDYIFKGEG